MSETISIPFELARKPGADPDEPMRTRYRPYMPTREEARRQWPHHAILCVIRDGIARYEPVDPIDDGSDLLFDGLTVTWPSGS